MPEHIARFILEHDLCVLATSAGDAPHASLMSYAADAQLRYLFMATPASSRKWANLGANPRLSLLIDERERVAQADRHAFRALTVSGEHIPAPDKAGRRSALAQLSARHPGLRDFFHAPGMEVICVRPLELLLLTGAEHAEHINLKND